MKPELQSMPVERHPFPPFLPPGARILFLGSFPPQPKRWCMPFYYPNWINDFWRIMGLIHFDDKDHFCISGEKRFDEEAIRGFCSREGLAFHDTASEVIRLKDNASDAFLEVVRETDIEALLERIPSCDTLVTTGQKATEIIAGRFGCPLPPLGGYIGLQVPVSDDSEKAADGSLPCAGGQIGLQGGSRHLRFWRMPSSSRAYPLPLHRKAEIYRRLFETI